MLPATFCLIYKAWKTSLAKRVDIGIANINGRLGDQVDDGFQHEKMLRSLQDVIVWISNICCQVLREGELLHIVSCTDSFASRGQYSLEDLCQGKKMKPRSSRPSLFCHFRPVWPVAFLTVYSLQASKTFLSCALSLRDLRGLGGLLLRPPSIPPSGFLRLPGDSPPDGRRLNVTLEPCLSAGRLSQLRPTIRLLRSTKETLQTRDLKLSCVQLAVNNADLHGCH